LDGRTNWRSLLVPALLGAILVGISYWLYSGLVTPPVPPATEGTAAIYVDDPRISTQLQVTFDPAADRQPERTPLIITLAFSAPAPPPPKVQWALVLYDQARLDESTAVLPSDVEIINDKAAADPPLVTGEKRPVQVIHGTADLTPVSGRSAATVISGELLVEVSAAGGSKHALSLPRYGRMQLTPPFSNQPGAIDIGIPGPWSRPNIFQVDVDAGPNGTEYRIDTASPSIDDPARLRWQSGESVRALVQRTNLRQEADQQTRTFILGAAVGAGIASILTALERLMSSLRLRTGREPPAPGDTADPPEPAD
jgi:hypothetical protein